MSAINDPDCASVSDLVFLTICALTCHGRGPLPLRHAHTNTVQQKREKKREKNPPKNKLNFEIDDDDPIVGSGSFRPCYRRFNVVVCRLYYPTLEVGGGGWWWERRQGDRQHLSLSPSHPPVNVLLTSHL